MLSEVTRDTLGTSAGVGVGPVISLSPEPGDAAVMWPTEAQKALVTPAL